MFKLLRLLFRAVVPAELRDFDAQRLAVDGALEEQRPATRTVSVPRTHMLAGAKRGKGT